MIGWGWDDLHVLKIYNTWSSERYEDAAFDLPDYSHLSRLASGEYSVPLHKTSTKQMRSETMGQLVNRLSLVLTSLLSQNEIEKLQNEKRYSSKSENNPTNNVQFNSPMSVTYDPSMTQMSNFGLSIEKRPTDKSILSVIKDFNAITPKTQTYESSVDRSYNHNNDEEDEERTMIIKKMSVRTKEYVLKSMDAAKNEIICVNDDGKEVVFTLNGLQNEFLDRMKNVIADGKKRKREVKVIISTDENEIDCVSDVFIRSAYFE